MDIEQIRQLIKEQLSPKRYEHTLRVKETAVKLAKQYDIDEYDVAIAALFHDYAKDMDEAHLQSLIKQYQLPRDLLDYDPELWHGPVAAKLVELQYNIKNEAIYNAIYYHTTAKAEMGLLELIIFVADYIEPARKFPGVDAVRKDARQNITIAARNALKNTIMFLLSKDVTIHPHTFLAYNDLTKTIGVK